MVKRPSSSTQSAASIIRSVEQAAPPGHMPEAPKGFHWAQATLIRGWFLVPDGWFFREERKPTVIGYFISREDSRLGKFQVGLTVNAKRAKEGDVVANARQIIETLSKAPNFKLLSAPKAVDTKLISGARCRVEIGEGQNAVIVDQMQLGNSRTNAMYSIGFEAPKAEWDEAWRVGQQLMASFGLSDEF